MGLTRINDEVYETDGEIAMLTARDVAFLKRAAAVNPRRRARICAHHGTGDRLHEMVMVHAGGVYIRPHKHLDKSESFHIIEGRLKVFLFDDAGKLTQTIQMGEPGSGDVFFYRLQSSVYHSVLPESDFVVYHEVTNGPFDPARTIPAPWAPAEGDAAKSAKFLKSLLV